MKRKILSAILIIWLAIFLIDIICAFAFSRPIFMLEVPGCEITQYYGIGYTMNHYYGMLPEGYRDSGFSVNPFLYLVINGVMLARLVLKKQATR